MIIGRDILSGKSLYTDVTDTKPVGIFLFYAALEFLFGNSIFWKRFVFAILVGVTGFLISRISKKLFHQDKLAFAAGLIYIIYTSIWTYHGRSPNTELLFNFFTASSLLFLLKRNTWNYMFAGLFMGIGFMVKYLVLFDFAAFFTVFLYPGYERPEKPTECKTMVSIYAFRFVFCYSIYINKSLFLAGKSF